MNTERTAQTVHERLEPLIRRTPLVAGLRKNETVWVEPKLTATIEFRSITEDGMLSQRDDHDQSRRPSALRRSGMRTLSLSARISAAEIATEPF